MKQYKIIIIVSENLGLSLYCCICCKLLSVCFLNTNKADKPIAFFQALKERQTQSFKSKSFAKNTCQHVKALIASYKVSLLIAKRGLPFNVAESLVVPAMKKLISTVMEGDPAPVPRTVPLSDTTVKRQIDKMGRNIED